MGTNTKLFFALTLLVFRISIGQRMQRQLKGSTDPNPTCNYNGINWNLDLDCYNCQHEVNVDALDSNSESFVVATN